MTKLLWEYRDAFLSGLAVTLQLACIAWVSGLVIGTILALAAIRHPRVIGVPVRGLSFVLSAIPVLVLLFWVHYPLQQVAGVIIRPFITAAFVLSITNILVVESIIRAGVRSFPKEYREVARVQNVAQVNKVSNFLMPTAVGNQLPVYGC